MIARMVEFLIEYTRCHGVGNIISKGSFASPAVFIIDRDTVTVKLDDGIGSCRHQFLNVRSARTAVE